MKVEITGPVWVTNADCIEIKVDDQVLVYIDMEFEEKNVPQAKLDHIRDLIVKALEEAEE